MGSRPKLKLTITTMLKSSSNLLLLLLPVFLDAVLVKNHLSVLRHKLLENGVYDKNVKPDGKINVKVGFSLIDLDLHPKTQTLETHGWTYISWNDPRLAWDKLDYDGIDRIRIHQKEIWVPDIVPFNLVEEPHYYTPTWDQGHKLIIYDNGNVIYAPQVNYKTYCNFNFNNWPWGEQNCTLEFGSWTYDMKNLDIVPYLQTFQESPIMTFQENPIFSLAKNKIEIIDTKHWRCESWVDMSTGETYPRVMMKLTFKQKMFYKYKENKMEFASP